MDGPGNENFAESDDAPLFPRRPRWVLILIALIIMALAAIALRSVLQSEAEPAETTDPIEAADSLDADFGASCERTSCEFEASGGTSEIEEWLWDFGDGQTETTGASTTHDYTDPGPFLVSLTVSDGSGETKTVTRGLSPGGSDPAGEVLHVAPPIYHFGPHIGSSGGWELLDAVFTGAHVSPHPDTVIAELEAARSDGKSIILLLARSAGNYKNPDGTFSLEMWKSEIDLYAGYDFRPWVEDGTFLVHYLISEPMSRSRWGGEVITVEVLDEMARYSKELWPYLPTTVREQPTDLLLHAGGYETPVPGWEWSHLDSGWARYSARKGQIDEFIASEVAAAREQQLGLLFGMNVLAGGDGRSETVGYDGGWTMAPDELLEYGQKLIEEPYGCANVMWHLNHDDIPYFGLPEIATVVADLADSARAREPIACTVNDRS